MSKPTKEQLDEVLAALVGNGLDFFLRSAHELDKEQKFAIAHFATALELLLKARLFHEHWTLIATEPHKCAWTSVKDGTARTLQASDLCAAIASMTDTPLTHEKPAFEAIFKHRNRVLHWAPNGDLAATVAEQCLAWHFLSRLLAGPWRDAFSSHMKQIEEVEKRLREHLPYLQVRYEQHSSKLKGMAKAGRLLECPTCGFASGVAEEGEDRILPFECLVCSYAASAARFSCEALYPLDELPVDECGCGERHDRQELIDELDSSGPKDEPDRGHCGECLDFQETVVADGAHYVCVGCAVRFEPEESRRCEWCNGRWFGWDSEDSYLMGCEHCDGRGMDDD